jgi:hypothetical protein
LDLLDPSIAVRPAMSKAVNADDIVRDIPSFLDLIVTPPISFDTAIQNTMNVQRDFTYVPDDIAELAVFFEDPRALDDGNAPIDESLPTLPKSFPTVDFDDEFIPSVEDVDESLFVPESVVLPDEFGDTNSNRGDVCFGIATTAELENVRRGGVRRSESNEKWASRSFDDWMKIHGLSVEKSIGDLSEEAVLKPLTDMLIRFMLETKKQNGDLYHPNT